MNLSSVRSIFSARIGAALLVLLATPTAAHAQAMVIINPAQVGATLTNQILGANMGNWFNPTLPGLAAGMTQAGITATRWPGGSNSDLYHLATNSDCFGAYVDPNATFDNFVNYIVKPAGLSLAITLNYGTNAACDGGGDPKEAAAWVAYAKTKGYAVSHWTIGNEVYGTWEKDLHAAPNDPKTYANAVATGFYPAIKAVDPNAQVGVVVDAGDPWGAPNWDQIVLSQAPFDFVEYHWYGQGTGHESDAWLIGSAPSALAQHIATIKRELAAAGKLNTPIVIGELGSVAQNPGKQSMSITQALFAGEVLGEIMQAGVQTADWWIAHGDCRDPLSGGNYASSLYGWQNFGGYQIISDGLPEYGCPNAPTTWRNTLLPTAQAFKLASLVALNGEHILGSTVSGPDAANLRAYAMTNKGGTAVMLFNLGRSRTLQVTIGVTGVTSSSDVTVSYYDRATYDLSRKNIWRGITTTSLGARTLPLTWTLTPWSMTVVQFK
ncbi:hypothetical protein HUN39_03710 [Methylocystis sp. FS]|uniref:hypothetical protein n=1 Tax=Methylocystis silviterrae TaxID=2743612 RepID=UPI0015825286|nr:hypothetical protein [Methylocystis silviterrae]NUJ79148.1 hypothetical protein [Methylocystis silviterrae]